MARVFFVIMLGLLAVLPSGPAAWAKHLHPERYYQQIWCDRQGGQMEVVLSDGTRCDCLLPGWAVEVDFGRKWAEGIGQALHYARLTGRRAGVLLIIERPKDLQTVRRLRAIARYYGLPLDVWVVPADLRPGDEIGRVGAAGR